MCKSERVVPADAASFTARSYSVCLRLLSDQRIAHQLPWETDATLELRFVALATLVCALISAYLIIV